MAIVPGTAHARLMPTLDGRLVHGSRPLRREEQAAIFARRWMLVGRADEIARPGSYIAVDVAGESVIVIRRGDAEAVGFLNVCRHRGARLLLESSAGSVARSSAVPTTRGRTRSTARCRVRPTCEGRSATSARRSRCSAWPCTRSSAACGVNIAGQQSFADDIGRQLHGCLGDAGMLAGGTSSACRAGAASFTTSRPTGKLIVENSWSATTARRSTPSSST